MASQYQVSTCLLAQVSTNRLTKVFKGTGKHQTAYLPLSAVGLAKCSGDKYFRSTKFREVLLAWGTLTSRAPNFVEAKIPPRVMAGHDMQIIITRLSGLVIHADKIGWVLTWQRRDSMIHFNTCRFAFSIQRSARLVRRVAEQSLSVQH